MSAWQDFWAYVCGQADMELRAYQRLNEITAYRHSNLVIRPEILRMKAMMALIEAQEAA